MADSNASPACLVCASTQVHRVLTIQAQPIVRCADCGLTYYWPLPTVEEQAAFYHDQWADKDSEYQGNYGDPVAEQINLEQCFLPRLDLLRQHGASGTLLDVGCSVGTFLAAARDAGWEVEGIDLGKDACETAATRAGCRTTCTTLEGLGGAGERFDAIHASQVIEHVLDPRAFVQEANRLLKPGGAFFVGTPVIEPAIYRWTWKMQAALLPALTGGREYPCPWAIHHPFHVILFTQAALCRLLEQEGFEVVHTRLVPWQSFYKMNLKWRVYYRVMNLVFALLGSGMNVDVLAVKR